MRVGGRRVYRSTRGFYAHCQEKGDGVDGGEQKRGGDEGGNEVGVDDSTGRKQGSRQRGGHLDDETGCATWRSQRPRARTRARTYASSPSVRRDPHLFPTEGAAVHHLLSGDVDEARRDALPPARAVNPDLGRNPRQEQETGHRQHKNRGSTSGRFSRAPEIGRENGPPRGAFRATDAATHVPSADGAGDRKSEGRVLVRPRGRGIHAGRGSSSLRVVLEDIAQSCRTPRHVHAIAGEVNAPRKLAARPCTSRPSGYWCRSVAGLGSRGTGQHRPRRAKQLLLRGLTQAKTAIRGLGIIAVCHACQEWPHTIGSRFHGTSHRSGPYSSTGKRPTGHDWRGFPSASTPRRSQNLD